MHAEARYAVFLPQPTLVPNHADLSLQLCPASSRNNTGLLRKHPKVFHCPFFAFSFAALFR